MRGEPSRRYLIPASFVLARCLPTAAEIAYGVNHEWLGRSDAVAIAEEKIRNGAHVTKAEVELAMLLSDELWKVVDILPGLEAGSPPEEEQERLWIFLALEFVWENKHAYADPYDVIEWLHSTFGYPEELVGLVRWMPVAEHEPLGMDALDRRWLDYLVRERAWYASRTSD